MGMSGRRGFRAAPKTREIAALLGVSPQSGQHQKELFPVAESEGMGVLSDGTPYLTARGLARMCGVDNGQLIRMTTNWSEERLKPRGQKIQSLLAEQGFQGDQLYLKAVKNGTEAHAYTDKVCMAILEYYAFDATQGSPEIAQRNYRLLARASFRAFIYAGCGFDPDRHIPNSWRNFHERVLLNDQIPVGYFCIFREIADLVIHLIRAGCPLDQHTVPDISVGQMWSKEWLHIGGNSVYGQRRKHPHVFPEWFAQSAANPVEVWIYPNNATGAFQNWMHLHYIPRNLPNYVDRKVKEGSFLPARGQQLIAAVSCKQLPADRTF